MSIQESAAWWNDDNERLRPMLLKKIDFLPYLCMETTM